jgi:hypothetical protein
MLPCFYGCKPQRLELGRSTALFSDPLPLLPASQLLLPSECINPDASALSLLFSEDHHKVR